MIGPVERHPRLSAAVVAGVAFIVIGAVVGRSDPTNGLRIVVVGAALFAFGGSGLVAMEAGTRLESSGRRDG